MFFVLRSSFLCRFQSLKTDTLDCIQPTVLQPVVLKKGLLQPGVLTTTGLTTKGSYDHRFLQPEVPTTRGSYNQGS